MSPYWNTISNTDGNSPELLSVIISKNTNTGLEALWNRMVSRRFGSKIMLKDISPDPIRQEAFMALTDNFVQQGHPAQYAQALATSIIFQTDLDLRNAQLSRVLAWLKQEHVSIYPLALEIVEETSSEFENRVLQG